LIWIFNNLKTIPSVPEGHAPVSGGEVIELDDLACAIHSGQPEESEI